MKFKKLINAGLVSLVLATSVSCEKSGPLCGETVSTTQLPNGTEIQYASRGFGSTRESIDKSGNRVVIKYLLEDFDEETLRMEGTVTYIDFAKVNPEKKSSETNVISQSAYGGSGLFSGGKANNNAVLQNLDDIVIRVKPIKGDTGEYVLNIQKEDGDANPASLLGYIKTGDKISFPIGKTWYPRYRGPGQAMVPFKVLEIMNQTDTYTPSQIRKSF